VPNAHRAGVRHARDPECRRESRTRRGGQLVVDNFAGPAAALLDDL
jgi:hypothetical protein